MKKFYRYSIVMEQVVAYDSVHKVPNFVVGQEVVLLVLGLIVVVE
jgi:hypothetical protein